MIPYLFNKFQMSKWTCVWNLTEIKIAEGHDIFLNFKNMDRP